ncbi:hypothetical protein FACS1894167_15560 [Synergistales bacterium]|nr:hypothetical protein FACS1894167_15560 [Synergistales bacterium]
MTGAAFTQNECFRGYSDAMKGGIERYGVPLALYTDKHTIFRPPNEKSTVEQQLAGEDVEIPLSNFGKALVELNIEHIKANMPQAKGRIERLWETLRDRLPVELRLLGVKSIEEANNALPELIRKHNEKYAVLPAEPAKAYRPLGKGVKPDYVFAKRETRKVGSGSEISYKNATYVPKYDSAMFDARTLVEVRETVSGEVLLRHCGKGVVLKKIARSVKSAAKCASPVQQPTPDTGKTEKEPYKPAKNHPWRRSMNKKDTDESQINNTTAS